MADGIPLFKDDIFFLLYIDNSKNIEKIPNGKAITLEMSGIVLAQAKIDTGGKLERTILATFKEMDKTLPYMPICIQMCDDEVILTNKKFAMFSSKFKIGRAKIQ